MDSVVTGKCIYCYTSESLSICAAELDTDNRVVVIRALPLSLYQLYTFFDLFASKVDRRVTCSVYVNYTQNLLVYILLFL